MRHSFGGAFALLSEQKNEATGGVTDMAVNFAHLSQLSAGGIRSLRDE
jgi:hypothetical protein